LNWGPADYEARCSGLTWCVLYGIARGGVASIIPDSLPVEGLVVPV